MTKLVIPWIKEKIYTEIGTDELVFKAINRVTEEMIAYYSSFLMVIDELQDC